MLKERVFSFKVKGMLGTNAARPLSGLISPTVRSRLVKRRQTWHLVSCVDPGPVTEVLIFWGKDLIKNQSHQLCGGNGQFRLAASHFSLKPSEEIFAIKCTLLPHNGKVKSSHSVIFVHRCLSLN